MKDSVPLGQSVGQSVNRQAPEKYKSTKQRLRGRLWDTGKRVPNLVYVQVLNHEDKMKKLIMSFKTYA
jgi:hypothetical protein